MARNILRRAVLVLCFFGCGQHSRFGENTTGRCAFWLVVCTSPSQVCAKIRPWASDKIGQRTKINFFCLVFFLRRRGGGRGGEGRGEERRGGGRAGEGGGGGGANGRKAHQGERTGGVARGEVREERVDSQHVTRLDEGDELECVVEQHGGEERVFLRENGATSEGNSLVYTPVHSCDACRWHTQSSPQFGLASHAS